jgi:hypothetical protein
MLIAKSYLKIRVLEEKTTARINIIAEIFLIVLNFQLLKHHSAKNIEHLCVKNREAREAGTLLR